ncbi:PQQ-binding-like beta-propeller repeat protein [Nocardia sp. NPDC127579]|uniref:outer membrane protein assembly factor BamB family protein n=1 Tax=Nocardia sp. NPDC127579 TaxID=3345402 RepID=UPI003630D5F4
MSMQHARWSVRPLGPLAVAAISLIGLGLVLSLISVIADGIALADFESSWDRLGRTGAWPAGAQQEWNSDTWLRSIAVALQFAGAVVFLCWLWRARRNAEALFAGRHRLSIGWVIGAWVCPIVNLWFPRTIMADVVRASDPRTPDGDLRAWPGGGLVNGWWATMLLSWLLTFVALVLRLPVTRTESTDTYIAFGVAPLGGFGLIVVELIEIGALVFGAVLLCALMFRVRRGQEVRAANLSAGLPGTAAQQGYWAQPAVPDRQPPGVPVGGSQPGSGAVAQAGGASDQPRSGRATAATGVAPDWRWWSGAGAFAGAASEQALATGAPAEPRFGSGTEPGSLAKGSAEPPTLPMRDGDPAMIGRFTLLGRLGSAGIGTSYLARGEDAGPAVVRTVRLDPLDRTELARTFAAARTLPGTCAPVVLDADSEAEHPWIATEYAAGATLRDLVDTRGPLPYPVVEALAAELARVLSTVHAAGLVHGDLTPDTVVVTEAGPRLLAVGLPALPSSSFGAPEQLTGDAAGPAADMWSFGGVLAYALTGRAPFGDGSGPNLLHRMTTRPPDLTGIPESGLRLLLVGCLVGAPDARLTTAQVIGQLAAATHAGGPLPSAGSPSSGSAVPSQDPGPSPGPPSSAGSSSSGVAPASQGRPAAPGNPPGGLIESGPWDGGPTPSGATFGPTTPAGGPRGPGRRVVLAAGIAVGLGVAGVGAFAVTRFRGGPESGAAVAGSGPGRVRWKAAMSAHLDLVARGPAVARGKVFVAGDGWLTALDTATGRTVWQSPLGDINVATGPVTSGGDTVIVGDIGAVAGFDVDSGARRWQAAASALWTLHATDEPANVYTRARAEDRVIALDARTGRQRWGAPQNTPSNGGLAAAGNAVAVIDGTALVLLDATTGVQRWRVELGGQPIGTETAIVGDTVLVQLLIDDNFRVFDLATGQRLWTSASKAAFGVAVGDIAYIGGAYRNYGGGDPQFAPLKAYDQRTGRSLWRAFERVVGAPAVADGKVYAVWDSELHALDAATGDLRWSTAALDVTSGPVVVDRTAFVYTRSGIAAIDL